MNKNLPTLVEASMNPPLEVLTFEVTVEPGQRLALPEEALQELGAGRCLVSIQRSESLERSAESGVKAVVRDHGAFLKSYADEDESLYHDCSGWIASSGPVPLRFVIPRLTPGAFIGAGVAPG